MIVCFRLCFGSRAVTYGCDPRWHICMDQRNHTFEKHYRVRELAKLWSLGRETVRKLVANEPDVVKVRMGRRKAHTIYSVPESVAHRIHRRLAG